MNAAADDSIIRIRDATKVYQLGDTKVHALRGVSLTIRRGEFVAIMGASGSGKSTLMNILGCLDKVTAGEYLLEGIDVAQLNEPALARIRGRRIGFVFQTFNLLARTSAIENVELPLFYAAQIAGNTVRAREMLQLLGLSHRERNQPNQLSGGQQQRVAIARALVQQPDIILADEPIASLDPRNTKIVMDALLRINKHFGITVICNLHSLDLARSYCDRLIGMSAGRVVFDGAPATPTDHIARELYDLEANDVMGGAHVHVPDDAAVPALGTAAAA